MSIVVILVCVEVEVVNFFTVVVGVSVEEVVVVVDIVV